MSTDFEKFLDELDAFRGEQAVTVPPKAVAKRLADGFFHFLFPMLSDEPKPSIVQYGLLRRELINVLASLFDRDEVRAERTADEFFASLPALYADMRDDAEAFLAFDPAATCLEEVVATYPGFYAVALYRLANRLHRLQVPLLPRVWSEYVHGQTGIDIHPAATIGKSFFIDHGTGVVIGQTAVIGDFVKIYQGVTLGALQVDKSLANVKRHPTIEDHCVLYANSTILGGRTVVGHHSVIGGNTWLTESVAPYSVVLHQSRVMVRTRMAEEPLNFVI